MIYYSQRIRNNKVGVIFVTVKQNGWIIQKMMFLLFLFIYYSQDHSQLARIVPFSLPSIQCSEDLRVNHISMQTLHMSNRSGVSPTVFSSILLQLLYRLVILLFFVFICIFGILYEDICINFIILTKTLFIMLLDQMMQVFSDP